MRFLALALDDDGTIAWDNVLGDQVRQAIATLLDRHLQTTEKSAGIDLYGGVMACLSLRRPFKKNRFLSSDCGCIRRLSAGSHA